MRPKHRNRRLGFTFGALVLLGAAAFLILTALQRNISYFYTPSEALAAAIEDGAKIRLGGLVAPGSVMHAENAEIQFTVTDGAAAIDVSYAGILPDLFREGQGVIAQGAYFESGFIAHTILAKHDENYVPKELAEAMPHTLPAAD
ncbi:MAG: cytochrome c maturation protein CcmE [Pseudomonadota bacterium]